MPFPPPPRIPSGPRRRTLLASAAGTVLLAGCSDAAEDSGGGTGGSPSLTERTRARAALDSRGLVEHYDAVLAARPALAGRLAPLRAEVVRHVEAFGGRVPGPGATGSAGVGGASASGGASAATSGGASGGSSAASPSASTFAPGDDKSALVSLAAAEKELADRRTAALVDVDGELARLLASVAAAGAVHAYLLTEAAK
ncbi:hypothetical protein [Streptomyces griseosporeus]|uniref:hypothetical protein n=1 Tax=Streptomyces griseosporeus TaxID=1910 RepID=UPI0036FB2188